MELTKIELVKNGKKVEYKIRTLTANLYVKALEILKELKQSEFEINALELATQYEKTKDLNIAKEMIKLQGQNYDSEIEIHNFLVYCKLLELMLDTKENFETDFWLEQDKELIEQFIVFFRKSKKLTRV